MKVYFELNRKEKIQEWMAIVSFLVLAFCIGKGVYNQANHIAEEAILVPLAYFFGGFFLLVLGINGLSKGNLVFKYLPAWLEAFIKFITAKTFPYNKEKARQAADFILGLIAFAGTIICFIEAVKYITESA